MATTLVCIVVLCYLLRKYCVGKRFDEKISRQTEVIVSPPYINQVIDVIAYNFYVKYKVNSGSQSLTKYHYGRIDNIEYLSSDELYEFALNSVIIKEVESSLVLISIEILQVGGI